MSKVLGKRKADATEAKPPADPEEAQAIFRRYFEAQFKPLQVAPIRPPPTTAEEDSDDEDLDSDADDSEWGGLSDAEDADDQVEVIDHASAQKPISSMSKSELKKFMSSRPPTSEPTSTKPTSTPSTLPSPTEDEDAPSLLANDLALQRLLSESNLLSRAQPNPMFYPSSTSSTTPADRPFAAGRLRLATTDLRLRALGSRDSLLAQKKMPLPMRRGIEAAAAAREARRRREAKENGVVLEREAAKKTRERRRGRRDDVDLPAVGRLRGAELRLSERDVGRIRGEGGGGGGGGRGGRSGRGGGGGGRGGKKRR